MSGWSIKVPPRVAEMKHAIADMRAGGSTFAEIGAELGMPAGSIQAYCWQWRKEGDPRFHALSPMQKALHGRYRKRLVTPWPRWRQLRALIRAGLAAEQIAALLRIKVPTVHQVACRLRRDGLDVPPFKEIPSNVALSGAARWRAVSSEARAA